MTYVARVGMKTCLDDESDEIYWEKVAPTWDAAKEVLLTELEDFLNDECDTCRVTGTEAYQRLLAATGPRWEAEVDGSDYWIEPAGSERERMTFQSVFVTDANDTDVELVPLEHPRAWVCLRDADGHPDQALCVRHCANGCGVPLYYFKPNGRVTDPAEGSGS